MGVEDYIAKTYGRILANLIAAPLDSRLLSRE